MNICAFVVVLIKYTILLLQHKYRFSSIIRWQLTIDYAIVTALNPCFRNRPKKKTEDARMPWLFYLALLLGLCLNCGHC